MDRQILISFGISILLLLVFAGKPRSRFGKFFSLICLAASAAAGYFWVHQAVGAAARDIDSRTLRIFGACFAAIIMLFVLGVAFHICHLILPKKNANSEGEKQRSRFVTLAFLIILVASGWELRMLSAAIVNDAIAFENKVPIPPGIPEDYVPISMVRDPFASERRILAACNKNPVCWILPQETRSYFREWKSKIHENYEELPKFLNDELFVLEGTSGSGSFSIIKTSQGTVMARKSQGQVFVSFQHQWASDLKSEMITVGRQQKDDCIQRTLVTQFLLK